MMPSFITANFKTIFGSPSANHDESNMVIVQRDVVMFH